MPVFTAAAAAIASVASAIGFSAATAAAIGSFVVRTLVTVGISKLIANRANKVSAGAQDAGARIQLAPATNNKLPVVYGSAYIAPVVTDAKISTDQKTMWYVCALCEKTSGTISFGDIYYDGKLVTFGTGSNAAKVVSLTTNTDPAQVDTKIDGNLYMYLFTNGSSSGVNTGGQTAIQILQDASIPATQRWTSTDLMTNTAFLIVKVVYNRDADTVNLGQISVQVNNTVTKPGDVLLDYMQDSIYGCAIPLENIDTVSLTALNTYSDELITYVPVFGGTASQPRYRINGPINTGDNCLSNLQQLADSCDSWLQYSELTAQWKVVINKPYSGTLSDLYHINSNVLIGGIDINPLDLNQTYNSLEVQYPDANIKDQTNYKVVDLTDPTTSWYDPTVLSPNEPDNRLVVQYPQVNNYIQAVYLGVRRLLQSREDLTINCNLDYSGIQIEAGDVVRVTLAEYGWVDKLFRVSQVQETKTPDGFLGARITAFEYNGDIYSDNTIQDYIPEINAGISDPNIIATPAAPTVTLSTAGTISQMTVVGTVPSTGQVLSMDFNVGNSSNSETHTFYTTVSQGNGAPYAPGATVTVNSTNLPANTYYWSVTARNKQVGVRGPASTSTTWTGPSVTTYDPTSNTGGISGSNIKAATITGGLIAAGALAYSLFGNNTGTSSSFASIGYYIQPPGGSTVTIPVSATTTGIYNTVPIYVPGSTVSSSYWVPYFSGTATTANGYFNNSTGQFTPWGTAYHNGYNGDLGYYSVIGQSFSTPFAVNESFVMNFNFSIIPDADTTIQYGYFVHFTTDAAGVMTFNDQDMQTVTLKANQQWNITNNISLYGTGSSVDGAGIAIRNMTSGTTLYIPSAGLDFRKAKL